MEVRSLTYSVAFCRVFGDKNAQEEKWPMKKKNLFLGSSGLIQLRGDCSIVHDLSVKFCCEPRKSLRVWLLGEVQETHGC